MVCDAIEKHYLLGIIGCNKIKEDMMGKDRYYKYEDGPGSEIIFVPAADDITSSPCAEAVNDFMHALGYDPGLALLQSEEGVGQIDTQHLRTICEMLNSGTREQHEVIVRQKQGNPWTTFVEAACPGD